MTNRRDCPGRIRMPGVLADSGVSFGSEVLAAYMRIGLSNSCTSRPALYTERMSGTDARTRTRSGVNRKSSAVRDTVCIDPSHARRAATTTTTTRPRTEILPFTGRDEWNWLELKRRRRFKNRHVPSNGCHSQFSNDRQQGAGSPSCYSIYRFLLSFPTADRGLRCSSSTTSKLPSNNFG